MATPFLFLFFYLFISLHALGLCVDLSNFLLANKTPTTKTKAKKGIQKKSQLKTDLAYLCAVYSFACCGGRCISSFFLFIQNKYLTYGRGDRTPIDGHQTTKTHNFWANGKKLKKSIQFVSFFAFCGDDATHANELPYRLHHFLWFFIRNLHVAHNLNNITLYEMSLCFT